MILVIDNYDSFTYNLVQYLGEITSEDNQIKVYRHDKITISEIKELQPGRIIISPGPGRPAQAGISIPVIENFAESIPILGVCLGHQCIAQSLGANIIQADNLFHGKTSKIHLQETSKADPLFAGITSPFTATRYHSLIVEPDSLPDELLITAVTKTGEIMGIKHQKHPLYGVQFHPESILTDYGKEILGNFINLDQ